MTTNQINSSDVIVETKGLTKRFGGLVAVDDLHYQLSKGEIQCLIGPNGAGKSTFFGLLTGQVEPTSGTILYKGEDITSLEPHERVRRGISLKFQTINVYENLTVGENLRIPCQRTEHNTETQIAEIADSVDLNGRLDEIVGDLSHGEQQWLEIGLSISIDPDLLLLDEPTAGMTIEETNETGELITSLAQARDMTVVIVEHDINFVRQISDRVTVLNNGKIFRQGSIDEVANDPEVKRIYLGEDRETMEDE